MEGWGRVPPSRLSGHVPRCTVYIVATNVTSVSMKTVSEGKTRKSPKFFHLLATPQVLSQADFPTVHAPWTGSS